MESDPQAGTSTTDAVVVLLAAGAGSRFAADHHKLLARIDGGPDGPARGRDGTEPPVTVFGLALLHAVEADLGPVIVVTGAIGAADLGADEATRSLLTRADVVVITNPDWSVGQSTSVRVGLEAARQRGATSAVIGLADQPFVTPEAWRAVAAGLGPITVATYDGRRGNPVRLHADVWGLLPTTGDAGARVLMHARPDLVGEVPCTGSPADIDTVEDLHRWQSN